MKFREEKKGNGLVLNVTSLIDVMFLLLIFFMVTSTFRNQPAINLVLPRSSTATDTVDTPTIIFLTADGEAYINDALVTIDKLPSVLAQLHADGGDDRMVLRADEKTSHGDVVEMIDLIKTSGFQKVSLSARSVSTQ